MLLRRRPLSARPARTQLRQARIVGKPRELDAAVTGDAIEAEHGSSVERRRTASDFARCDAIRLPSARSRASASPDPGRATVRGERARRRGSDCQLARWLRAGCRKHDWPAARAPRSAFTIALPAETSRMSRLGCTAPTDLADSLWRANRDTLPKRDSPCRRNAAANSELR